MLHIHEEDPRPTSSNGAYIMATLHAVVEVVGEKNTQRRVVFRVVGLSVKVVGGGWWSAKEGGRVVKGKGE